MNRPALTEQAAPAWGTRRLRKGALLLAVLALHGLLLLSWLNAVAPHPHAPLLEGPGMVWLQVAPAPEPRAPVAEPARAQVAPRPAVASRLPSAGPVQRSSSPSGIVPAKGAAPTTLSAVAAEPAAPASAPQPAATPAPPRLLDTEATRQAVRQIGRQPLLSERAAEASDLPIQRQDARLAEAAAQAGKGDCLKGEFLGGGAGLLSVPFLALAAARGQCAK